MKQIRKLTILVGVLGYLMVPTAAHASYTDVLRDCLDDGALAKKYSNQDLRGALKHLSSENNEYSDCKDVIAGAITKGGGSGAGTGGGGGGAGGNPVPSSANAASSAAADRAALAQARKGGKGGIAINGKKVKPGGNGLFNLANAANGLPTPLLITLIALAVLAILHSLVTLRRRIPLLAKLSVPSVSLGPLRRVSLPRFRR